MKKSKAGRGAGECWWCGVQGRSCFSKDLSKAGEQDMRVSGGGAFKAEGAEGAKALWQEQPGYFQGCQRRLQTERGRRGGRGAAHAGLQGTALGFVPSVRGVITE